MQKKALFNKFMEFVDEKDHLSVHFKNAISLQVARIINKNHLGNPFKVTEEFSIILSELSDDAITVIFKL